MSEVTCPMCKLHGEKSLDAQGVVLSAAQALINGDEQMIISAAELAEPYDFHMAVTLYVDALETLADYLGHSLESTIEAMKEQLREARRNQTP